MAEVVSCKNQNSSYRGRFFFKGKLNLVQVKGGGVRVTGILLIFISGEKFYMWENQEILKLFIAYRIYSINRPGR